MSFLVSPGVEINEIDRTDVVPALSTSIGGYAGDFNWGPYQQVVSVSNEKELGSIFSTPTRDKSISNSFLTASSFLKYGRSLRVVRTLNTGANTSRVATGSINPVSIFNFKDNQEFESRADLPSTVFARYPGEIGNSIQIKIAYSDIGTTDYNNNFSPYFDYIPKQTEYAQKLNPELRDEIHILVIDVNGKISGKTGTILEKYQGLSLAADAKGSDGASLWYGDVVNRNSKYIYISSLSFIFSNADVILSDNPSVAIARAANANIKEAFATIDTLVIVANTGYINGDQLTEITSGSTRIERGIKLSVLFRNPAYTNLAGNGCRLVLKPNATNLVGNDPTVSFDIKNSSATAFDMDVTVNYDSRHSIKDIVHALNRSEDNLYDLPGGSDNTRAYEFTAHLDETYIIKTSNADVGDGTDSLVTSVRLANSPSTIVDIDLAENSYAKVLTNLIPSYGSTVEEDYSITLTNSTQILSFAGAVIAQGSLTGLIHQLEGGLNRSPGATATSASDIVLALEVIEYVDRDLLDINYLFTQQVENGNSVIDSKIRDIVEGRRDMIGFISAPTSVAAISSNTEKMRSIIEKFDAIESSSFLVFDSTPLYVYNKYQDNYSWIPACGHMAGLCANTDLIAEPWFSPAGFNRGQLRGVTKLALNPTQLERDDLYKKRINPIVSFPGQGIVLFGDKTALSKSSAFDRINVRKLFNVVERTIARYAKSQLFEINDEFTRNTFKAAIEPFLRDVRGRRGISDYRVVCDETNNDASVIDTNRFVGDIYIKPVKSINFISLNFVATRSGVAFNEIAG